MMSELGAAKSGLIRPSRVGPTLDPDAKLPVTSEVFSCCEGREMNPAPRYYDGPVKLLPRKSEAPALPADATPETK